MLLVVKSCNRNLRISREDQNIVLQILLRDSNVITHVSFRELKHLAFCVDVIE